MTTPNSSLGFLLADITRLLRRSYQLQLAGSALTLAQAKTLLYVSRNEGIRQVDLAELLEIKPITLARLIDQLVEAGVVMREQDPNDRRAYRILMRSAAQHHLEAIDATAALVCARALTGFSDSQAKTIFDALSQMRDNLSAR